MKIALTSSLFFPTPPSRYGSIERVAGYLADALVELGQDVTIYASGDSPTKAKLRPTVAQHLVADRSGVPAEDQIRRHYAIVAEEADRYDIVNIHTLFPHFMEALLPVRERLIVSSSGFTRQTAAELADWRDVAMISLSDAQRALVPPMNWRATIGAGLPLDLCRPEYGRGDYLVYVGRISKDKGVHRAARVAFAAGVKLKLVGTETFGVNGAYRDRVMRPFYKSPWVEYLGELEEAAKQDVVRGAMALVLPTELSEAFGLVLIEAMACGTPVIGWRNSAIPEVVDEGVTGHVVGSMAEALAALPKVAALDRRQVRARFEQRFSIELVARRYLDFYRAWLSERGHGRA